MDEVGVRELRQNLSVYLRRVSEGERFIVTDRRERVAMLAPYPPDDDLWETLIAQGRLSRPTGDLLDVIPTEIPGDPYAGTRWLEEQRGG